MSFKLKLVAYFLLVSLLPLGAAAWGLHSVARRSETRGVDVRLESGLRSALAGYKDALDTSATNADRLARNPDFQRALEQPDLRALRALLADVPNVGLRSPAHRGRSVRAVTACERRATSISTFASCATFRSAGSVGSTSWWRPSRSPRAP